MDVEERLTKIERGLKRLSEAELETTRMAGGLERLALAIGAVVCAQSPDPLLTFDRLRDLALGALESGPNPAPYAMRQPLERTLAKLEVLLTQLPKRPGVEERP